MEKQRKGKMEGEREMELEERNTEDRTKSFPFKETTSLLTHNQILIFTAS